MRYVTAFCLFVLLSGSHRAEAQVLPSSDGSCAISTSGALDCAVMSALTLRRVGTTKTAGTTADLRPKLSVIRCILAPGAPLNPLLGSDVLIVGMNNGELVNEKKSPQGHVSVSSGSVMLMLKEEQYLLRNIGKESLELLVIEVRK